MLKKFYLSLLVFIVIFLTLGYTLLFTKAGKFFMKPKFQEYIANNYSPDLELIDYNLHLTSMDVKLGYKNFIDININGSHSLFYQDFNLNISGKSKSLKKSFKISGDISGKKNDFTINLLSNIASSDTTLSAKLKDSKILQIYLKAEHLNLEEFLPLFANNNQLNGKIDLLIDKQENNNGDFTLSISNAYFSGKPTHFNFLNSMLKKRFSGIFQGDINQDYTILAQGDIRSDIYTAQLQNLKISPKKLLFDYELFVPNITNLHPKAKQNFSVQANGQAGYTQGDGWDIKLFTKSFDGQTQISLQHQKLEVNFLDNNINKILHFINIPQNIQANLTGTLHYSVEEYSGNLEGNLEHFSIKHNAFMELIRKYTKFDIQKENFRPAPIHISFANQQAIINNLNLQSQNIGFSANKIILDCNKMNLDALLKIRIKNSTIHTKLFGNTNNLQTRFDLNDILRLDRK